MIDVRDATEADLVAVLSDLREIDRIELLAAGANLGSPVSTAQGVLALSPGFAWTVWDAKGRLLGAFGLSCTASDHIMNAWAYGGPRFVRAIPTITRLQPAVAKKAWAFGVRRITAASHALHREAHGWLESGMRFRFEGVMKSFGCDGSDFLLYGLTEFGGESCEGGADVLRG